ncbi:MAG: hypothetical protein ABGX65_05240 [Acidimicrobiales bacterium]
MKKFRWPRMTFWRLAVAFFAVFSPLAALWAVPAAASPVFFTELDEFGCQHDDIAGIDLWSCPDGSEGATDPDGSGNATDADGCRTEWGPDELIYYDSCAPTTTTTTTTTQPPTYPTTETDPNGCEITHSDEWNSTWECPDGSNGIGNPLGSGWGSENYGAGCSRSWNGGGVITEDTCASPDPEDDDAPDNYDEEGCWVEEHAGNVTTRYCGNGGGSIEGGGYFWTWGDSPVYGLSTACSVAESGNGSNVYCGAARAWWDGAGNTTFTDPVTACTVSTYADGSSVNSCDDGTYEETDVDGETFSPGTTVDAETGCTITTYTREVSETVCEDGTSSGTYSDGSSYQIYFADDCWVEENSDGTSHRACDDGTNWFTNEYGRTIETFTAPEGVWDEETGCTVQTFEDGSSWSYCNDGEIHLVDEYGNSEIYVPPATERFEDGSKKVTYDDGTIETWTADGTLQVSFPNGDTYRETFDEEGTTFRLYPNGSQYTVYADGSRETVNPWGETSRTVEVFENGVEGWLTTHDSGATHLKYENGDEFYQDPSGFTWEAQYNPQTGERTTTSSDGSRKVDRDDGTFVYLYSNGTEDIGVLDAQGNVIVALADGSSGIVRPDGRETWTDPYGYVRVEFVDEDGNEVISWEDGWTETISADGLTHTKTGPDGESELSRYHFDGTIETQYGDGASKRFDESTGITTYTTKTGSVFLMSGEGYIDLLTDPAGTVFEYNELTNTTTLVRADGSTQTAERTADGGYRINLGGDTVLLVDSEGNQRIEKGDGLRIQIEEDGTNIEMMDGQQMFISDDGEMMQITYDFTEPCTGDCVEETNWDHDESKLTVTLADGTATTADLQADGSLIVEVNGETRIYHPSEGVDGATTTYREEDGSQTMETEEGGVVHFSKDGQTMSITDEHGNQAEATEVENGYVVMIEGEEHFFPFGSDEEPTTHISEGEFGDCDEFSDEECGPGGEEDHDAGEGDFVSEGEFGDCDEFSDEECGPGGGEDHDLAGATATDAGNGAWVTYEGQRLFFIYTDQDWADTPSGVPNEDFVALKENNGILVYYEGEEWFVPFG